MAPTSLASSSNAAATLPTTNAWRVEVFRRPEMDDPAGQEACHGLIELGLKAPADVRVGRGYLLSPAYTKEQVQGIADSLLADPVMDEARLLAPGENPKSRAGTHRVLSMRKPGVMNPVAGTVEGLLVSTEQVPAGEAPGVSTFTAYEIQGDYDTQALTSAARRLFGNETIEFVRVDREDLPYGGGFGQAEGGRHEVPLLTAKDAELTRISVEGQLSLTLTEMLAVQTHYRELGREPSSCELETIAQTWSEHCKHKTLCGIVEFDAGDGTIEVIDNVLKETIARATHELDRDWCISVFEDNAGIIAFDKGMDLAIKVETHNHPSAIDPYGGAGTGIGGVIRDILGVGLGARPIANTDSFFVGPPDLPADELPKGSMHPRRILRGVVAGVRDYGNRMGIPTLSGGVWFDKGYTSNPLVYAGTVGLIPREMAFKEVRPGDAIVTVGGRTGRDGIHGATFSSIELSEDSETDSSASVQIGDPITEKCVLDTLLKARDLGLYRGITDCGAGGFSSAVGEMGEKCGAEVELSAVPLKYPGLSAHEVWISEAQERMVLSVPPEKVEACLALFATEDVEAVVIGHFTDSGQLVIRDQEVVMCDLSMDFLHNGTPRPTRQARWVAPDLKDPGCPPCADAGAMLLELLGAPNIASKEWILRQYDHEVQGNSVVKPLVGVKCDGPSDASVLKPLEDSDKGAVIACGCNPNYSEFDPYAMALANIDEALRNAVAVGVDPDQTALLDNFSWGNCDKPEQMGSIVLASKACYDAAMAFRTPFVSGKDSLNNEYRVGDETLSIPATLLITALGVMPDVARAVTMDLKQAGNRIYQVGATRYELAGSHYHRALGLRGGKTPQPDLARAPQLFRALHSALAQGLVASAHDLSEGGLAVAAGEMAFAGGLGLDLHLKDLGLEGELPEGADADALKLFSESSSRFLVEVEPANAMAFEAALKGMPLTLLGSVQATPHFKLSGSAGKPLFELPIEDLRQAHQSGFQG